MHKKRRASTRLLIAYFVLMIVLISAAAALFYEYTRKSIYEDGVNNLLQLSDSVATQIDSRLTSMEQVAVDVMIHADFQEKWEDYLKAGNEENEKAVKRILIDTYKSRSDIRSVAVFDDKGDYICTSGTNVTADEVVERVKYINANMISNQVNSRMFEGTHTDFWNPNSDGIVISEIKPIKNNRKELIGYIEIQQNHMYIERACNVSWNAQKLKVHVFTDTEPVLFYANYDTKGQKNDISRLADVTEQVSKLKTYKNNILATAGSNYYAFRVVITLKESVLYKPLRSQIAGIIVVGVILFGSTALYLFIITRKIMKPINTLVLRMEQADLTKLQDEPKVEYDDYESYILSTAYENMAERLHDAREKEKHYENVQTKTLFGILQQEISPHFLYNTLGSIANMCEGGDARNAADACYNLTDIIRYASDYSTADVSIKEEVDQLKAYLAIMKNRYRQRLSYTITLDEKVPYFQLPKLTLQPIVENAIKYSLLEHEHVIVAVKIYDAHGAVCIEVVDNGCGIVSEKRALIEKRLDEFTEKGTIEELTQNVQFGGMGLSGTLARLSIFFGDMFSYLIKNNDKGGLTVAIYINLRWGEEQNEL